MSRTPEPRPALRRADDGEVHPAAPRATPEKHLHPAPPAPAVAPTASHYKPGDLRARKAGVASGRSGKTKKGKKGEAGETVPLNVDVPKKLRKAIRRQAESESRSVDDLVTDALMGYLER